MSDCPSNPSFETSDYKVFIDDNDFVSVTVWGHWTMRDAEQFEANVKACLGALGAQGKPRLILYDAGRLDMLHFADSPATRGRVAKMANNLKFDALANFGSSTLIISMMKLLSHVSKDLARARMFGPREDAVKYLNQQKAKFELESAGR